MELLAGPLQKVGLQLLLDPAPSSVIFRAACNTVAVAYPVYSSFKAIEDKSDYKEDVQWLTYWTIYGTISLLEFPFDRALASIPYYYHAKFALMLWLQMPQTKGAQVLYEKYWAPTLKKYQPKIDMCVEKVATVGGVIYGLYRGPIDAGVLVAQKGFTSVVDFVKWFFSSDASQKGAEGNSKFIVK